MARRTRGYFRDNQRGIEEILGKRTTDFAESGSDNTLKTKSSQSGTRVELEATGDDSNINIAIVPKGSGKVQIADAYYMPTADGSADQVIKTDGAGNLSFGDGGSTLGDLTAVGSTLLSPSNADLTLTTAGTGDVRLEGINVVLGYHGGVSVENMIVATGNGSVALYYDNSKKVETSSTGVTVTGNISASDANLTGNLQVDGNLTVSGTTTSVNSTNITVSDPLIILSETNSGSADVDSGIMIERGSAGNNAVFYWNEGDDKFKAVLTTSDGTTTSVTDSSVATIVADLEGTADIATTVALVATNTTDATHYITFVDAATGNENIRTDTNLTYNPSTNIVGATAVSAYYADLAERYSADADYEPGTVMMIGGEREITQSVLSHNPRVIGVVSTAPAYLMNSELENGTAVALQGRTPCRVVGVINKGDQLVSSAQPGVAQKLDTALYQPGCVIGKALQDYNSETVGVIEVVIGRL